MSKVNQIHIGNLDSGIIIMREDGTQEVLEMTEACYADRQKQADFTADFWKGEGARAERQRLLEAIGDNEPLTERQLLHKWLGGQSAELEEKVGRGTLLEILKICERRRGY